MPTVLDYEAMDKLVPGTYVQYCTRYKEPLRLAVVHSNNPATGNIQLVTTDSPVPKSFNQCDFMMDGTIEYLTDDEAIALFNEYRAGMGAFSNHIRSKEHEKGICKRITG